MVRPDPNVPPNSPHPVAEAAVELAESAEIVKSAESAEEAVAKSSAEANEASAELGRRSTAPNGAFVSSDSESPTETRPFTPVARAPGFGEEGRSHVDSKPPEFFMAQALELAERGRGRTFPNPAVGSLVVSKGQVVGRGFHRRAGEAHAELEALRDAGELARGADLYVTLEPCNHHGRTAPCTQAILDAKIARVFVGMEDPNPLVSGSGIARLRRSGVEVVEGVLSRECVSANRWFAHFITTKRPYVILKAGVTLDGKLASASGDSKWVTSEASRELVHRLRDEVDAILVGSGTVAADQPLLTTRLPHPTFKERPPRTAQRVVVDGSFSSDPNAQVFDPSAGPVLLVSGSENPEKQAALEKRGVTVLKLPRRDGEIDVQELLELLGRRGITSLLVEGGARTHSAFLRSGMADELRLFIAPKILGAEGLSWAGNLGASLMSQAILLEDLDVSTVGGDVLVQGRFRKPG